MSAFRTRGAPDVGFAHAEDLDYPKPPFDPPVHYPEFGTGRSAPSTVDPSNRVYALVREALFRTIGGYAAETDAVELAALRALGPARSIVVKPNWVRQQLSAGPSVTTHGAVLRPVIDYLHLAFPDATISVVDVPLQSADLNQVWDETGVSALRSHYEQLGIPVNFVDLRRERAVIDESGFITRRERLQGDPLGYAEVALGASSYLDAVSDDSGRFSVNDYEPGSTSCRHERGRHAFFVPRTVLASDLFVNIAKLKTHCKTGITGCMKNLVGINGDKAWLPHFRAGAPSEGGDEYPNDMRNVVRLRSVLRSKLQGRNRFLFFAARSAWRLFRRSFEATAGGHLTAGGAWEGNDTLWRCVLDLARVIAHADADGILRAERQRSQLCLIDGIVAGEGQGPLVPTPRPLGVVIAAGDALSADLVAARVMGFDWRAIPFLREAVERAADPRGARRSVSWSGADPNVVEIASLPMVECVPPKGWPTLRVRAGGTADPARAEGSPTI